MSTLEQRITTALTEDVSSVDVEALITETEAAIAAADDAAEEERQKALDPIASPDPNKARQAMEDAAFTRDRLCTVLPRLQARFKQVEPAEYLARCEPDYEQVKAVRDALAAEMQEVYPAAVARLADLFQRMEECDRECSRINGLAPYGEHRRLLGVELTARGVEILWQPDVWIAKELRPPAFPATTARSMLGRSRHRQCHTTCWCPRVPDPIGTRRSRYAIRREQRKANVSAPSMSARHEMRGKPQRRTSTRSPSVIGGRGGNDDYCRQASAMSAIGKRRHGRAGGVRRC